MGKKLSRYDFVPQAYAGVPAAAFRVSGTDVSLLNNAVAAMCQEYQRRAQEKPDGRDAEIARALGRLWNYCAAVAVKYDTAVERECDRLLAEAERKEKKGVR